MAKSIRKDLEGVVSAYDEGGRAVTLKAGDTIPDGVEVGDHVLAGKSDTAKSDDSKSDDTKGYDDFKVAELKDFISARNEGREEDDLISTDGVKADLVKALEADDATQAAAAAAPTE